MPRRKSLLAQILADRQRAKAQRERANRQAEAQIRLQMSAEQRAYEKRLAEEERRAAQRERDAQRDQERSRLAQEREAAKAAAEERRRKQAADRAAAAQAAQQRRVDADRTRAERAQARAEKERARAQLAESVKTRNDELGRRLQELESVLSDRPRWPVFTPQVLEDVFNHGGPDEFCVRLQDALITASYPLGVPSQTSVLGYRPEAHELIVERELPRISVIPAEGEFRIVRGEIRAVSRKDTETRHLYGQLLARTALRTLADVFTATPATLVRQP